VAPIFDDPEKGRMLRMAQMIDKLFLMLSSLMLVLGVALGSHMGMQRDFALVPLHAHINLIGWLSLAVFGLAYRSFPELGSPRARLLHFATAASGAILFPVGMYLELTRAQDGLVILASVLWVAGALIFAVMMVRLVIAGRCDAPSA
jgi:hypothetical protein